MRSSCVLSPPTLCVCPFTSVSLVCRIVSHQATLRVLYAYLTDRDPESVPNMSVPLHTVIQLTPQAYGCEEVRHKLI